ncbi:DsbA family protein [Sphingomonas sp. KRR8]|uniref:DsbA family protein n=1 Tax=Sphingomonas sp. KRR8 TaxID=2942996 RepID=UPI00202043E3|nr:DsbA family protein [Sphingomonas sp. KRR8]URD61108.1 DsbA family protein [Sphingomonas sp. KRR8]
MKTLLAGAALILAGSMSGMALSGEGFVAAVPSKSAVPPTAEADIEATKRAFLDDAVAPQVKPANYDVTIVEYADYQCPYCRTAHDALVKLAATDKKVRIIFRDWPIFGPQSQRAARLAIASQWQGKFLAYQDALMKTPRPLTEESIRAAAAKAGVDWTKLEADLKRRQPEIEALLDRNDNQAMQLGLEGTPGFIIGDRLYSGGMNLAGLKEAVAQVRKSGGKKGLVPVTPQGI